MKAGMLLPQIGDSATRENVLYIAKEAEKEGLDSVWVLERLLWQLKPQTPYLLTPHGSLPAEYQNVLDPLETLTYLAGNTEQISLGTCVIDILFHNPVVLARRFATLDILSHGRVIAGLGIGWSKDEYDVFGVSYQHRGERANEFLQLLKRIWTDEVVEFKGKFYSIPASKIGPKPVQKPHPPILLGGWLPTGLRMVNYADGRLHIAGFEPLEQLEQAINGLREGARKAKDPYMASWSVFVLTYPNVIDSPSSSSPTSYSSSSSSEQQRLPMTGTIDQIGTDIDKIKAMGVEHIIFGHKFSAIGKDMNKTFLLMLFYVPNPKRFIA